MTPLSAERIPRLLVTGGAGFIGHHLVAERLLRGAAVTVLDDGSTGSWDALPAHPALRRVVGCVTDPAAVSRAVGAGVDRVYHLAGVVGVRLAVAERRRAHDVTVNGTRAVLAATGDAPVVLFSSSAVYGLHRADQAHEQLTIGQAEALEYDGGEPGYATGKWRLEQLGARAAQQGRGVLVVRPFNVVGLGQIGAYGMVLPRFLAAALAGRPLVVYDDGAQSRAFSGVATFLQALRRLEATPRAWGSVVNVGAPTGTTILQLAHTVVDAVAEHFGIAAEIRHRPYGEVFPGRVDVRARVPDPGSLTDLIGPLHWPDVTALVAALLPGHAPAPASRAALVTEPVSS